MQGKVVVITGGTSGIGRVAAERLAGAGARMVLVARDKDRAHATLAGLQQVAPGILHSVHFADLSKIDEVRRVANEIAVAEPHVDVLINNAGALFYDRQVTTDGLERTFATNHVAYFVLTQGLLQPLRAAAPSRVVNTSSEAHRRAKLDFDDLQCTRKYRAFTAYDRSKLCNILFTRELARTLAGTGVTANCLHPGFVDTRFGDGGRSAFSYAFRIARNFGLTPEKGAETIIYLASSPDVAGLTGEYFAKCTRINPTSDAQDDESARRLWRETAKIVEEQSGDGPGDR
jgi:NAD(P)-dependent dehydrogenase (short-subunit alcohol dehydrogenase family)